jgi:predicted Zn-dependent peptidase
MVYLGVDPRKARKAVRRVAMELHRLKKDGVSAGELRSVKQQIRGSLVLGLESSSARMSRLARQQFYLNDYITAEESLRSIMRVRRASLNGEARRTLDPSLFSMITVGPPGTDFPRLEDLDF